MKRNIWIAGVLAAILGLVSGCSRSSEEDMIKIGVVGPFTGDGATYGAAMMRGLGLAFKNQKEYELVYEDSRLSPRDGIASLQKLISSDGVKVVFGAAASGVSLAMAPVAQKNNVILFSSISTADELGNAGNCFFRNVPSNEMQGITAARFVRNELKAEKVAIYKKNDDYAINLSKSFISEYKQLGGQVVLDDSFAPGCTDFRSVLTRIKQKGVKIIYIPSNYKEAGALLKQARELGVLARFVGGDGAYSPELIEIAGNAAEGSFYTVMGVDESSGFYKQFEAAFWKEYEQKPDVYDAYAYEAGMIILRASEKNGHSVEGIRQALLNGIFDSMTGPLKFSPEGEVAREYTVLSVKDGEFVGYE